MVPWVYDFLVLLHYFLLYLELSLKVVDFSNFDAAVVHSAV